MPLPKMDTTGLNSFIPADEIESILSKTADPDRVRVRDIIAKSLDKQRLEPEETAVLINTSDPELVEEIKQGARDLKTKVYGNRIVLFAPLYIGNDCVNDCTYCGFRCSNRETLRKTLSLEELQREVEVLEDRGHKRLILVYGEHSRYDARFIHDTVRKVYSVKRGHGEIRRVNINAAPLDEEGYRLVKSAGIGTYQIFMETYHEPTYARVHPSGPKSSFLWRLHGLDRAFRAGIDDVGIGALLGLYKWQFEVMGLLYHTIHFEETFGVGPHTISFPRIEPALGSELTRHVPHQVSDEDFKKLVAILRLSVPYTGLILTCREPVELRNEVLAFGVSQIDAGSDIGVGAYATQDPENAKKSQFVLADGRSLDQVIGELAEAGYLPSFCTACYRAGRTGEHFMEFAVPGFVKRYCTPNAALTLLEYLNDYASPETREKGLAQLQAELDSLPEGSEKNALLERIRKVNAGERDLYY
ncbi:MAG TPA: [FeFe] hydrogenase H-cluster radical SAM maturase HydG [Candidatus Sabulitectum sp.]|nr:[FeFe] hydrogenase H-cluster radical SAM maturase HydG [Candidatus Sabulitectum sp.]HPF32633.1 [FeFe] hydrogenase H-cluster radical SAM maturase HydG [Candidatus Sabulitectum sp.]HPJ27351.1 [FeFe] hydrogenase H-cluster radical SAM maturase HydG [Candidatus Sabulitectum sp.]HPR21092.1 [FeFe] hydrogenase H-cluster radical SAM maturase HydG [Candidatus Sabulitectum sp.]